MSDIRSEAFYLVKKGDAREAFEKREHIISNPSDHELLIEVEAFGLNYADVMARKGLYKEAPSFPCVIGYEVVGTVLKVGPSVDQSKIGKRVLAFCRFGAYAKHVITNDLACVEVENQDASELLALATQGVTAYYMAEYLTPIRRGDIVLIHAAAGGVGTLLVQLAKKNGAFVIAKVGTPNKEELVRELGADLVVNYKTSNYVNEILKNLNSQQIDISFNPVAGSTYKMDMALLGAGGRMVLFGASELSAGKWGILSKLNFVRKMGLILPIGLMMRSKSVIGVNMLKIADQRPETLAFCLSSIVELYKKREIYAKVGQEFPSERLAEAHTFLESGKSTGKITIKW